jgi:hypothetical protein
MFHLKSTIVNLERNHVVFVAILFSCQGTDVRERAAILPDPHVRVKRVGFTSREAHPSDADTLTARMLLLERSAGLNFFAACRDRGVYFPSAPLSTAASKIVNSVAPLTIPSRGIIHNHPARTAIPAALAAQPAVQIRVTACFSKDPVPLRDQP